MKAINLYNGVAAGTPAKIVKYNSHIFVYDEEYHDYYCETSFMSGWLFDKLRDLNEEVEIIEPKKEVDKYNSYEEKIETCKDELTKEQTIVHAQVNDEITITTNKLNAALKNIIDPNKYKTSSILYFLLS